MEKMLVTVTVILTAFHADCCTAAALIPLPVKVVWQPGTFALDTNTTLVASGDVAQAEAQTLAKSLRLATGFTLPVSAKAKGGIMLTLDPAAGTGLGPEGYTLTVAGDSVHVTAATAAGLFYAGQTLRQLLPPAIFAKTIQSGVSWQVPCCRIEDRPRFAWRGFMLDSSRHFQTAEDVKHWLDLLAMHKLNVFHWHLVDDHGWRFESKKYPLLTQVGAWREQPPIGRYGGFYTQQEMRETVAYAAKLHITIVPEIEMPGHSRAALAAYPNLACGGKKTEVDHFFTFPMSATVFPSIPGNNVFCAGKEETFRFLEDVLSEVIDIFPSKFIHVGGDEVNMGAWQNCADCRAAMKTNHLATGQKLQAYFMRRIEKFLGAHGRKLIGWDEILEGGLSPAATVMSWRGTAGGIQAAKSGHDAVMSPEKPLYFDHRQSTSPQHPPGFGGSVETLKDVYEYDPVPTSLSSDEARHILGVQANLWSCATESKDRLELFAFPRLCALAEIAWCPGAAKKYEQFQERLGQHDRRLDVLGINYWRDNSELSLGKWTPNAAYKAGATFDIPLQQTLAPGPWTVRFNYLKGVDALTIDAVELLADGAVVAADVHEGTAGAQHIQNQYSLLLPQLKAGTKVAVRTKAHVTPWRGGGNGDSWGSIAMYQPSTSCLGAPERPLSPNRATTPDVQNRDRDVYDRAARHRQVVDRFETIKPEILVIGDSIVHCWGGSPVAPVASASNAWRQAFGDRAAANLGFGEDRTENVLWRIDHGELDGIEPKLAVLLIGTNNLERDSAEEVFDGIDAICRRIHVKLPAAPIVVLGILPRKDQARLKADLDVVNYLLETRLHSRPYLRVLDLGNKFRNPDGSQNEALFSDGLQLNLAGYGVLGTNLAPVLKDVMHW